MTEDRYLEYQESIPDASYVLTLFWYDPDPHMPVVGVVMGRCDVDGGWRIGLMRRKGGCIVPVLFTASDMEDALQEFERMALLLIADKDFGVDVNTRRICRKGWRLE